MGLLSTLVLLPMAPVRGVTWIADCLVDATEHELHDPAVLRARLAGLNEDLEAGVISPEEFEREEDRLLELLERSVPSLPVRHR